jgi:hypothetical protein
VAGRANAQANWINLFSNITFIFIIIASVYIIINTELRKYTLWLEIKTTVRISFETVIVRKSEFDYLLYRRTKEQGKFQKIPRIQTVFLNN